MNVSPKVKNNFINSIADEMTQVDNYTHSFRNLIKNKKLSADVLKKDGLYE